MQVVVVVMHALISIHALLAESDHAEQRQNKEYRYFYPRSPCGERHDPSTIMRCQVKISIHALLAESDDGSKSSIEEISISIHALLAESDCLPVSAFTDVAHFYPRSPCGERPIFGEINTRGRVFLSTLSLRRATFSQKRHPPHITHFYPRSPCGERRTSL